MGKDLYTKYIWLIDTIYQAKRITFEEINERWLRTEMSGGEEISRRTFHNHRKVIETIFDINIECNKRGGYYYFIENLDDIEKDGVRNWLLNTFAVNNLINESRHLKKRILLEDIPSGREYLTLFIEAMRDYQVLEISYQSYGKDKAHTFSIEPYCLKVFKQRWYVVAHSPYYNAIMIYALDRIQNIRTMNAKFDYPKNFDPQGYFDNSFGIIVDEKCQVERIQIKAYGNKCKYFKALPLHDSQHETNTTSEYSVFEYSLCPTYDFCQELLSHGDEIEVIAPKWFRDKIGKIIKKMGKYYD